MEEGLFFEIKKNQAQAECQTPTQKQRFISEMQRPKNKNTKSSLIKKRNVLN
jgi:hypothetical protein